MTTQTIPAPSVEALADALAELWSVLPVGQSDTLTRDIAHARATAFMAAAARSDPYREPSRLMDAQSDATHARIILARHLRPVVRAMLHNAPSYELE